MLKGDYEQWVIKLIADTAGLPCDEIVADSRVYHDLGLYGDDAAEFLLENSEAFGVDITGLEFARHFRGRANVCARWIQNRCLPKSQSDQSNGLRHFLETWQKDAFRTGLGYLRFDSGRYTGHDSPLSRIFHISRHDQPTVDRHHLPELKPPPLATKTASTREAVLRSSTMQAPSSSVDSGRQL